MSNATLKRPGPLVDTCKAAREVLGSISNRDVASVAEKCFCSALERDIFITEDGETYIITGDIDAMWLRDSCGQVEPYLRFLKVDRELRQIIRGLIFRQARYILEDPYANAFNSGPNGRVQYSEDLPEPGPWVYERKYELDSLCYPVRLLHRYLSETGDTSVLTPRVVKAMIRIIDTMEVEQRHEADSAYWFLRPGGVDTDNLPRGGKGAAVAETGMVWSGFRPSDDACQYGYLIPSQMMAVVSLQHIADIAGSYLSNETLRKRAYRLQCQIEAGINGYGMVEHERFGLIYAYEVDGMGNALLMDDANVPSLLSMPFLGYKDSEDRIYQNTRRFILSSENPYYYSGRAASGVGSPHTPLGHIWHLALIMQALTSTDPVEQVRLVRKIIETTAGTGYMHESFHADDPSRYTRKWFGWANSMFAELVLRTVEAGVWQDE